MMPYSIKILFLLQLGISIHFLKVFLSFYNRLKACEGNSACGLHGLCPKTEFCQLIITVKKFMLEYKVQTGQKNLILMFLKKKKIQMTSHPE